ncbi:hypothetical protein HBI56_031870 [Parastagonospora nodorum]|uniref:Uncharacterized protein n=1 Tax=Phaeosphaeria nodorum (strain SN15 / ATCC MYA-4574 / FGSC 10173) TaxID=321614 RepID=A0A7U2F0N2_PHANO|nr:hypothetical protein HBH56_019580 [Parastagonospora nodorum]QRC95358.1 hypothetical protein JI435_407200 [Parastagonospora nodorum SN15]KAH3936863.1 hypothetical protein HBH54_014920 [Parastagonospora nodorum]KAH3953877.1 hypothetical protein HBH53_027070 [Parastagonospora nodorum]KAH3962705.1 hypothetical protein HBH51_174730 [Parastagonospora nodorum]
MQFTPPPSTNPATTELRTACRYPKGLAWAGKSKAWQGSAGQGCIAKCPNTSRSAFYAWVGRAGHAHQTVVVAFGQRFSEATAEEGQMVIFGRQRYSTNLQIYDRLCPSYCEMLSFSRIRAVQALFSGRRMRKL